MTAPVERAGTNDLLQLNYRPRPAESQVGAVLILGPEPGLDIDSVRRAVAERIRAVPRLRQRLVATPPGCGRPVWVDDPEFHVARHVNEAWCPNPGDETTLRNLAASLVTTRLPAGRPLWAATLVRGLARGGSALVLAFHHVLADGVGGLAALARLVDSAPHPVQMPFPRPAPSRRVLAVDAARSRLHAWRRLPAGLRRFAAAVTQLRGLPSRAPPTSLNRPTGPRRQLAMARADLAAVRAVAHLCGGKVNDVVLASVTGALHSFLRARGEVHDRLVVAVLVSGHPASEESPVRNQASAVPLMLPAAGDPLVRLRAVADRTRTLRSAARGASAAVMEPVFAALARLGAVRWYTAHQRRVNVFATNLRGPSAPLSFLGAPVTDLLPVNAVAGNVAVAFGALSYLGRLTVTVVADPEVCTDVDGLAAALQGQFDTYCALV